jgi:hypothetical protein
MGWFRAGQAHRAPHILVLLRNRASHAQGLEGSRFTRWQLYRLLAGGSRESPNAMFCPSRLFCCGETTAHRTTAPRDVPGSRLLLTHRAAMLRSGSPPGVDHSTRCAFVLESGLAD